MVTGEAAEGGDGGGRHQDQQQDRQLVQHHVVLRLAPRATRWRAVLITADNAAANRRCSPPQSRGIFIHRSSEMKQIFREFKSNSNLFSTAKVLVFKIFSLNKFLFLR